MKQVAGLRSLLHLVFIDFEKSFDRANRECIWKALRGSTILGEPVAVIIGRKSHVLHRVKISDEFEVQTKVCILSPIPFFSLSVTSFMLLCLGNMKDFNGL